MVKEKLEALSDSDISVFPSYSENFGMAVVEAMVCGVPFVNSNRVGIFREIEQNRAGIVTEINPQSWLERIKVLLDNILLKNEKVENGKSLVKEYYNTDRVGIMMIKAYEEIIRNDPKSDQDSGFV